MLDSANPESSHRSAEILTTMGQVVRSATLSPGVNRIDVSDFPSGVYLLRTSQGELVRIVVD